MSIHPANSKADVIILGLGNTLLRDEGVGVHIVNRLSGEFKFSPEVPIIDGGTFGLDLLPYIENKEYVLLIDAVNFNKEPGFIGVIMKDKILTQLNTILSVHHLGLADVLSAAKLLDKEPKNITLIGIQPLSIEAGLEMTDTVKNVIDEAIERVIKQLDVWGVKVIG
ncbi:MAG: HyaD/HybD family hydrogenase maturation endopeptidase [Candidatus Marinimicrobia bacterium]|nr:HyaD/HybD family hydrogenase maturation endopeptidase [Candidatus Neomarinimicrobiota bacterium]